MSNVDFNDRRTLTSDFSPSEMLAIAETSAAKAREYFFKQFLVPAITTFRYQEERRNSATSKVTVRLVPQNSELKLVCSFCENSDAVDTTVSRALGDTNIQQHYDNIFRKHPPKSWGTGGEASLSQALKVAYAECFPDDYLSKNAAVLRECVLIACASYTAPSSGGQNIVFRSLIKLKSKVRTPDLLLNQADNDTSPFGFKLSAKYGRPYQLLTGKWLGICEPGAVAEDCDGACAKIHASPAANCVWDDPEFS